MADEATGTTEVSEAEGVDPALLNVPVETDPVVEPAPAPAPTDPTPAPADNEPVYNFAVLGAFSTPERSFEPGERLTADDVRGVDVVTLLALEHLFDISPEVTD